MRRLDRLRSVKNRMVRLNTRVETVRASACSPTPTARQILFTPLFVTCPLAEALGRLLRRLLGDKCL